MRGDEWSTVFPRGDGGGWIGCKGGVEALRSARGMRLRGSRAKRGDRELRETRQTELVEALIG